MGRKKTWFNISQLTRRLLWRKKKVSWNHSTRRHLCEIKKWGRNGLEDIWGEKKTWFNINQLTRRLFWGKKRLLWNHSTRRHLYEMKKMGRNPLEDIWYEKKVAWSMEIAKINKWISPKPTRRHFREKKIRGGKKKSKLFSP